MNVTVPALSTEKSPSPETKKVFCNPAVDGSKSTVATSMVPSLSESFEVMLKVVKISSLVPVESLPAKGGKLRTAANSRQSFSVVPESSKLGNELGV